MTEAPKPEPAMLVLSSRDVQCVAVLIEMCATLLTTYAPSHAVQSNYDALCHLYDEHYSDVEWDGLRHRVRALLPADSFVSFSDPRLLVSSGTTAIQ